MLPSPLFLLSSLRCRSFQSDDSLTVILLLLLLLFGFGSAMKKLEGPLLLPRRRKASFYRRMRCAALSLEASGQGEGSAAERSVCVCQLEWVCVCVLLCLCQSSQQYKYKYARVCVCVCAYYVVKATHTLHKRRCRSRHHTGGEVRRFWLLTFLFFFQISVIPFFQHKTCDYWDGPSLWGTCSECTCTLKRAPDRTGCSSLLVPCRR